MPARIEKRYPQSGNCVQRPGSVVFVIVASLTSQSEIARTERALLAAWLDMLDGEGLDGKIGWAPAILTAAVGPLINKSPQGGTCAAFSHGRDWL